MDLFDRLFYDVFRVDVSVCGVVGAVLDDVTVCDASTCNLGLELGDEHRSVATEGRGYISRPGV